MINAFVILLLTMTSTLAAAYTGDPTVGPHGGKVIHVPEGSFEVVVDTRSRRVDLYALKKLATDPPQELGLWLRSGEQRTNVRLRTADPWRGLPHFQGILPHSPSLHPALSSSKGLEVELNF